MDGLGLFVYRSRSGEKIPVEVCPATPADLDNTREWQTNWTTKTARAFPNKMALKRADDGELLGLMSYRKEDPILAVEIVYLESAVHSNANLLHTKGEQKKYIGNAFLLL